MGGAMQAANLVRFFPHYSVYPYPIHAPRAQITETSTQTDSIESQHKEVQYSSDEPEAVDVTDDFVQECNTHYVAKKNIDEAQKMIASLRKLGGLDSATPGRKDAARARIGLVMLAGIKDHEVKEKALLSLREILEKDEGRSADAEQLMECAERLVCMFERKAFIKENISTQRLLAQVLTVTVEKVFAHFLKDHINAVTTEMKSNIDTAALVISRANRAEDLNLMFWGKMASQASKRLLDDKSELSELVSRFGRSGQALFSMIFTQQQPSIDIPVNVSTAIDGMEIGSKDDWYDALMFLRELGKHGLNDSECFRWIPLIISRRGAGYNWRFTYGAVDVLAKIILHTQKEDIRKEALLGQRVIENNRETYVGGLKQLVEYTALKKHLDTSRLTHLRSDFYSDVNYRVRHQAAVRLVDIAKHGDLETKSIAKEIVNVRLAIESDGDIKKIYKAFTSSTASRAVSVSASTPLEYVPVITNHAYSAPPAARESRRKKSLRVGKQVVAIGIKLMSGLGNRDLPNVREMSRDSTHQASSREASLAQMEIIANSEPMSNGSSNTSTFLDAATV